MHNCKVSYNRKCLTLVAFKTASDKIQTVKDCTEAVIQSEQTVIQSKQNLCRHYGQVMMESII